MNIVDHYKRVFKAIWEHSYVLLYGAMSALTSLISLSVYPIWYVVYPPGQIVFDSYISLLTSYNPRNPYWAEDLYYRAELEEMLDFVSEPRTLVPFLAVGFGIMIVVFLINFTINLMADGALIGTAELIAQGETPGFGKGLGIGIKKLGKLMIVSLIPPLPALIMSFIGAFLFALGFFATGGDEDALISLLVMTFFGVMCLFAINTFFILILEALRSFANRSAVIENTGLLASYKRGWQVLFGNFGSVIILFVVQWGFSYVLRLAISLVTSPISFYSTSTGNLTLYVVLLFVSVIIGLIIRMFSKPFFSVVWTFGWLDWVAEEGESPEQIESAEPAGV